MNFKHLLPAKVTYLFMFLNSAPQSREEEDGPVIGSIPRFNSLQLHRLLVQPWGSRFVSLCLLCIFKMVIEQIPPTPQVL